MEMDYDLESQYEDANGGVIDGGDNDGPIYDEPDHFFDVPEEYEPSPYNGDYSEM